MLWRQKHQATLDPLLGLEPPLLLGLLLSQEFWAPPSCGDLCLLTSGFAGLTSNGLVLSCGIG